MIQWYTHMESIVTRSHKWCVADGHLVRGSFPPKDISNCTGSTELCCGHSNPRHAHGLGVFWIFRMFSLFEKTYSGVKVHGVENWTCAIYWVCEICTFHQCHRWRNPTWPQCAIYRVFFNFPVNFHKSEPTEQHQMSISGFFHTAFFFPAFPEISSDICLDRWRNSCVRPVGLKSSRWQVGTCENNLAFYKVVL